MYRIGFGYDVHRLEKGHELSIGGIIIPHFKGSVGHSDADVLIHAICDSLLGAANLGDIGMHFPDTSPEYKQIDSKILLKRVLDLIGTAGYKISNIDSTLCLQEPKISPFIPSMKETLAGVLDLNQEQISIKATTNEKMGFVGREEGISAYAIVLLESC